VIHVAVSHEDRTVTVEHTPALVDAIALTAAVVEAGFPASVVRTIGDADLAKRRSVGQRSRGCCCKPAVARAEPVELVDGRS
jgi:hypothetical protein